MRSLSCLPKDNRWVKLGDTLPWDELDKLYLSKLNDAGSGASNLPSRMVIGALIIKHKERLSDADTIQEIRENAYMQYMLGRTKFTYEPIFDTSLFENVQNYITIEDIKAFTKELAKKSEARKKDGGR